MYLRTYAKLLELHFNGLMLSNCGDKVLKRMAKNWTDLGQIFRTFFPRLENISYCHEKRILNFQEIVLFCLALGKGKLDILVYPVQSVIQFLDEKNLILGTK